MKIFFKIISGGASAALTVQQVLLHFFEVDLLGAGSWIAYTIIGIIIVGGIVLSLLIGNNESEGNVIVDPGTGIVQGAIGGAIAGTIVGLALIVFLSRNK